jgi:hypothetical protein
MLTLETNPATLSVFLVLSSALHMMFHYYLQHHRLPHVQGLIHVISGRDHPAVQPSGKVFPRSVYLTQTHATHDHAELKVAVLTCPVVWLLTTVMFPS